MPEASRLLQTIGKNSFVQYYDDYKKLYIMGSQLTKEEKLVLARKLLENNPKAYKESGQLARINAAISLFNNGLEKEALQLVLNSTNSLVTDKMRHRAKCILRNL